MTNTADIRGTRYANRAACQACVLRSRCTGTTYLYIPRCANEAILERMAERIVARPGLQACRRELVEHPFGTIKHWMGQGTFLMRGLENVSGEFSLSALVRHEATSRVSFVILTGRTASL